MSSPALVAIAGRPNVGKSTLFNRLVGRRRALVTDEPGVTRDRIYGDVRLDSTTFRLIDTGGLSGDSRETITRGIEEQARAAIREAALVVLVVDARAGRSPMDDEIAAYLRTLGKRVVVAANKGEFAEAEVVATSEFSQFGLGPPIAVSAEHGLGIEELLGRIRDALGLVGIEFESQVSEDVATRLAIVGRPNVGKSSLLNALLGTDRVLVSEHPGTTRDPIDSKMEHGGQRFLLVDTAGIRRGAKWSRTAERLAALSAKRAISRAQVVALVLDATMPLSAQDIHIAGLIHEAARPIVVVVNKWDAITDKEPHAKRWETEIRERLRFARSVPVLFTSALTGQRVRRILDLARDGVELAGRRVPTPDLNRWLHGQAMREREGASGRGNVRLYYAAQKGTHPPSFILFCNDARRVHFSLRRRLENDLRERFGFGSVPIRLAFRSRKGKNRS